MFEKYLNHPTFGLLTRICTVDDQRGLFTTLYAQRLFFLITISNAVANASSNSPLNSLSNSAMGGGLQFETVSRSDAKLLMENRLRSLRRNGEEDEHLTLQTLYKRTFSQ
jgi:PII interaction protein X